MTQNQDSSIQERPIVAITMGDASGIGPEIIMKALARPEVHAMCRPLVVGEARPRQKKAQTAPSKKLQ